jgi:hypothetical protein
MHFTCGIERDSKKRQEPGDKTQAADEDASGGKITRVWSASAHLSLSFRESTKILDMFPSLFSTVLRMLATHRDL